MKKSVEIFTDGACSGNPGPGGWGAILRFNGVTKELSGGEAETTNNRMELMAAISALNALKEPCLVDLYTDSNYVKDGIGGWIEGWKRNGWKTAAKKPVKFYLYDGVNHAFNNDTSAERYDKEAATLAWKRTLDFFRKNLGA